MDTGRKGDNQWACLPVYVKLAPTKMEIQDLSGAKLSKPKLANGNAINIRVDGLAGMEKTEYVTYTAVVDTKYASCVTVVPVSGNGSCFTVTAVGLKNNKNTNVTVTFKCDQNGKKINFPITIMPAQA